MRPTLVVASLVVVVLAPPMSAQQSAAQPAPQPARLLTLSGFLDEVKRTNLDLAARRFDIPVAEAQITIARLFPDPQASAGASPLNEKGAPVSVSVGVSETIELGGKRGARIGEAKAGRSLAQAQLEDFFQTLRTNAANAFVDALSARQVLERKRKTLGSVETLVSATQERLRAGDVSPTALWQVKVEAERFRAEVIAAEGTVRTADLALQLYLAPPASGPQPPLAPAGELKIAMRDFDVEALVAKAMEVRSDLVASLRAAQVAEAHLRVARANRWIDPSLGIDWTHTTAASGTYAEIAPSIAFDAIGLSVGFPIPFSRLTHGELDAARASAKQAEVQTASTRHAVEVDVRQALARYQAARQALELYAGEVLTNADKALDATRYSYTHGAARLIELLDVQRTADDVYLGYADALTEHARALIALERSAGIWDVELAGAR